VQELDKPEMITTTDPVLIAEIELAPRALAFLGRAHEPDITRGGDEHPYRSRVPLWKSGLDEEQWGEIFRIS
jgi:hypothetical protein